ncbi:Sec34-like family protein [Nitzschia inconspicua]|uniref:Sec34-like family protein n=1 Tax=Nitzschia inconspicua TaxID=303405 RepID=A0A9K3PQZ1_9STRA|nr:Sec34-like family protein [Nitzschia inconspicua]
MASSSVSPPVSAPRPSTSSSTNVSYEMFAPRSMAQVSRLSRLAALTAGPIGLSETNVNGSSSSANDPSLLAAQDTLLKAMSPPRMTSTTSDTSSTSSTVNAFDKSVTETLRTAVKNSDHLTSILKHTTSLRLALRASINIAEDISNRHAELIRHSGELSAAADRLQGEQEMLSRHAEEIGMPLKHYDAVDNVGVLVGVLFKGKAVVRGLAKIKVDSDEFPSVLDQIDDAVDFFGRESGGRDALEAEMKRQRSRSAKDLQETSGNIEYYRRSLALQDAALDLIREAVVERISNTTSQVASALNIPKDPIAADRLEASLVYTRFHGISSRSNRLLSLVRKRLHRGDAYHELLQQCRYTYCNCRKSLLEATIRAHMEKLKDQHGLVGMTRLASVFLIRLCTVETALYLDFFGEKKAEEVVTANENKDENTKPRKMDSTKGPTPLASQVVSDDGTYYDKDFQAYLASLTSALHRTIRRGLVTVLDLDMLCQIVSVLREERSMASSSPTTTAAARAISSVIEDAQERLIFCATNSLTKEVIRFKPTPKDLDYPQKLKKQGEEKAGSDDVRSAEDDALQKQLQIYESWFPPMRSVLKILSKIFRVVEPRVFEDIALQSVQSCTKSLKDGAAFIQKRSGTIHSDLFLVKHLLILREQLSPFDIDLRSVERQLDFSDAGKAVSRFLANRNRRLFSMSTENALVTLLREGVSINEESVDSKRDLEEALRAACNDFIDHTCKSVGLGVMDLSSKLSAATPESLKTVPFFNAAKVKETLKLTSESFETKAAEISSQMRLYLDNPATQSILLKPISKKITKALDEIRKAICEIADGENDWNGSTRSETLLLIDDLEKTAKKMAKATR